MSCGSGGGSSCATSADMEEKEDDRSGQLQVVGVEEVVGVKEVEEGVMVEVEEWV